jgi:hypothetical protein
VRDGADVVLVAALMGHQRLDTTMLHPAHEADVEAAVARLRWISDGHRQGGGRAWQERLTWGQIAQRNGRIVHAVMESEAIGQRPDADAEPDCCCGEMGDEQLGALLPILTHHTSSPDGWFLLWDGFGDLNERVFGDDLPKMRHPRRLAHMPNSGRCNLILLCTGPHIGWPAGMSTQRRYPWPGHARRSPIRNAY